MRNIGLPVPNVPWPRNLFYQQAMATTATTSTLHTKVKQEDLCTCDCKQRHNHAVSKVVTEYGQFGVNYRIYWFATMRCRQKWEADNAS